MALAVSSQQQFFVRVCDGIAAIAISTCCCEYHTMLNRLCLVCVLQVSPCVMPRPLC